MLTSIFLSIILIRKEKRFVSKQSHPQPHIHSKVLKDQDTKPTTVKWSIVSPKWDSGLDLRSGQGVTKTKEGITFCLHSSQLGGNNGYFLHF